MDTQVKQIKAQLILDSHDLIGEGPAWDAAGERFLWMENATGIVHEARGSGASWRESQRWTLGRVTGAVIPRARGGLIVAAGTEILVLDKPGQITRFAAIDADGSIVKLNDAKCDRQGRLWVGTYAHDFRPGVSALYRVDPDGRVTTLLNGVGLSNGIDWSPDERTLYYIDSMTASVEAFDFDAGCGLISGRRTLIQMPSSEGGLDGMCVDHEGCLWLPLFGSGTVRRYTPEGKWLAVVETTAPAVTSCCFGGADGGDLFITSGALRIPDPVLPIIGWSVDMADRASTAPGAGGVFVCRPGVTGPAATPFAG